MKDLNKKLNKNQTRKINHERQSFNREFYKETENFHFYKSGLEQNCSTALQCVVSILDIKLIKQTNHIEIYVKQKVFSNLVYFIFKNWFDFVRC